MISMTCIPAPPRVYQLIKRPETKAAPRVGQDKPPC
jgi:hypothetical protein